MAITKVTASIGGNSIELSTAGNGIYTGEARAPTDTGSHEVSVLVESDNGQIQSKSYFTVIEKQGQTFKTDWKPTDRFNFSDYNRIKNNLYKLWQRACELIYRFEIQDMGNDINSYSGHWEVEFFNAWEENLEIIDRHIISKDYGVRQTFYENGQFIKWDELNRIESATLDMWNTLDGLEAGFRRLPFRFGIYKEVRI